MRIVTIRPSRIGGNLVQKEIYNNFKSHYFIYKSKARLTGVYQAERPVIFNQLTQDVKRNPARAVPSTLRNYSRALNDDPNANIDI